MASYEVELYELHATKYRIENATDAADAVIKALNGEGRVEDNCTDFVEIAESYGMSAEENRNLATKLAGRGAHNWADEIICGVRSVSPDDPDEEDYGE